MLRRILRRDSGGYPSRAGPSKNRVVLGLNAYSHDAACALFVDGALVFAAEEERYNRERHTAAFPERAVAAALAHAGLSAGDVSAVAFPWRRDMARLRRTLYALRHLPRSLAFLFDRPEGLPSRLGHLRAVARLKHDLEAVGLTAPLHHVEHHRAHAEQAWRFGPADEAALLTADGMGEWTATELWAARAGRLSSLARRCYPHSLGKVYAAVTQHLGFAPEADEGKTMGLSPYGRPTLLPRFRELLRPDARRLYRVALSSFAYPHGATRMAGPPFSELFGPPRPPETPLLPRHEDLALAVQAALEECVLSVARSLRERTGLTRLGLAGGLFLNCALNGRLQREAGFDSLFVFPAAGDAGAAAGAGAAVAGAPRREIESALLGEAFDDKAIAAAAQGRPHAVVAEPWEEAARLLAEGRTVGWFSGRMEFGPRALGARSILADPRDPGVKERLNRTVKFREDFRPFAPAVLEEATGDWFLDARPSPFMLFTFRVRPHAREQIPGVVHVDGTARVQTVGRQAPHRPFRNLLESFARRTGVPLVLNTSLNVRGQPIVRTPDEALDLFDRTALDALFLENHLFLRPGAPGARRT